MADVVLSACKLLALHIYERAKEAVANKADCEQLSKYVVGLTPLIEELAGSRIASSGPAVESLTFLRDTLQRCLDLVTQCCSMGWMKALVKAPSMRGDFTQVTLDLERALAAVPLASLSVSTQVQTDVTALRGDLVGAKFQMAAMQETLVTEMRKQAERARLDQINLVEMHEMLHKLVSRASGDELESSSRQRLKREIEDLKAEQKRTREEKDRQEEWFLEQLIKVLGRSAAFAEGGPSAADQDLDVLASRLARAPRFSVPEGVEVPRQFLCPISQDLMADPVMLVETGKTYDRCYIEEWFDRGNMTCPATGRRLKSCQLAPNIDFRSALEAWVQSATGSDVGADKASNQQPPRPGHPQSGRAATGKITHASTPPRPKSHRESARSARAGIVVHGVVRPSSAVADNQRGSAHRFRDSPPQQSAAVDNQLHHPSSHISPSRHQSPLANRQVSSPDRRSGEPRGLETSLSYGATAVRSKFWSPRRSRLVGQEHPSQHQTQGSSSGDADGVEPRMCHARGILPGPLDRVQRSSSPSSRGIRSSLDVTLRSWLGKAESLLGSIALNNGAKGTSSHVQTSAADLNASGSTNLSGSADSVSSISSLGSIVTLESSAEKDLPVGSERVIHGMLQVVADKELPAEDRVAALEVLRDVTHGAPAEISSAMNRSGGIQVLSAVLAQSEKDHCAVSALALQIVTNLTEDPGCLSSTLRAKLPAQAIHMLGFSDGDVSASAAKLVAALARQGGSAAESVADSSAMLPLVKMLQDGSTLSARAAAGCAIEELMKGNRKNKMVMEKANGVALLIELLKLGVSGARTGGLDGSTLACVAVTATNSLKDLAADSTNVQAKIGSFPGMMAALISLLHGSAGEAGQRSAVELLHRLVARVDENRLVFVKEPRAIASLVKLLQSPDAATVCDAAWIIGILSTWGAREDVIKQGAFQQLQKLLQASADPDIQVAAQFALRSL